MINIIIKFKVEIRIYSNNKTNSKENILLYNN